MEIDYNMGTATFVINMESSSDKSTFKGSFKVKCVMSPLDFIQSDAMYRELLGKTNPQLANSYVSNLAYALSQLKYRIITNPSWFDNSTNGIKGSGVDDAILLEVLDRAVEAEEKYRQGIEDRYNKARDEVKEAVDSGVLTDGSEDLDDLED